MYNVNFGSICSNEGLTLETSALKPIYIIHSVGNTKLPSFTECWHLKARCILCHNLPIILCDCNKYVEVQTEYSSELLYLT